MTVYMLYWIKSLIRQTVEYINIDVLNILSFSAMRDFFSNCLTHLMKDCCKNLNY